MRRLGLMASALTAAILFCFPSFADDRPLPAQAAFLGKVLQMYDEAYLYPGYTHYDWYEFKFPASGAKQGKYWRLAGTMEASKGTPEKLAALKAAFLAGGWSLVKEAPAEAEFHLSAKGVESFARVGIGEDVTAIVVEVGPNPLKLALKPPAAVPEKLDPEKGDFPYLPPPPDAVFKGGREDPTPFKVQLPGASQAEIVASTSLVRSYTHPPALSNPAFATAYHEALLKAGWEIISEFNSADVMIVAHYSKQGRNVWANAHMNNGDISFSVADGATDLKASLAKDCHVALLGLLFDFNKSTLQPASDPVLQKVKALLTRDPSLKVVIQGHTDNVGDDAYNQTLSEARAASVVTWLTAHGIAPGRLTSKGFGKSQPVADNGNDEGRAKNRRVEIADPACHSR